VIGGAGGTLLRIRPLGGRLGAEVVGLPRDGEATPAQVELLKDALADRKVLVMPGRQLAPGAHSQLVRRLVGPASPAARLVGTPFVLDAAPPPAPAATGRWVSDGSWRATPSKLVSFRVTGPGGGVEFTDAAGAYRDLPRPLRALADRSWAVHTGAESPEAGVPVAHPVTRLHPETGDRLLLLGAHARRVLELDGRASAAVLALLGSCLDGAHNVLPWSADPGDIVLADGRSVLYRLTGAADRARTPTPAVPVVRLAVLGETPLGVDGRHSHPATPGDCTGQDLLTVRSA